MVADPKPCQSCGKLVFGGETVVLPIADYIALLHRADQTGGPETGRIVPFGHKNRIQRDPELMAFVIERLEQMPQIDLIAACKSRFGADRAPSRSGLSRFIKRI